MSLPAVFLTTPIAHRALHGPGRPENSLAAVRAAVVAGYGIEIDVQPSADGVAMVFHDDTLDRLTACSGRIDARTAEELATLSLNGTEDGIPTLSKVLTAIESRVPLLIEIKDQDGAMGPAIGALPAHVAEALADYTGPVAVMSFNPHAVAAMADLAPTVPRGLTTCAWDDPAARRLPAHLRKHLAAIADFDRVGASFISHDRRDLDSPHVAALKRRGVPILCWTVRSRSEESQARAIADNITFEGYAAAHPA